jgi:hypothetical protein
MYFIALGVAVHSLSMNVLENGVGVTDVETMDVAVDMEVGLAEAVVVADGPAGCVGDDGCLEVCAAGEDWPGSK